MNELPQEVVLFLFPRTRRDEVRTTIRYHIGRQSIDLRQFYRARSGELLPSPKGVTLDVSLLPELKASVAAAEEALRATETVTQ